MDIESILGTDSIDTTDYHEADDAKETTRLIDVGTDDCMDHAIERNDNNGYSLISQLELLNNNNDDVIDGHDDESPLSTSELDGLLNHPSLELNGHSLLHTSTPVINNNKPAIQPKPNLEKLKNSKNLVLVRNAAINDAVDHSTEHDGMSVRTTVSSPDTLHENDDVTMRSLSPCKPKDPAEMSLKERLALFERNTAEAIVAPPKTPTTTNGSKRWTEKWLEQANRPSSTSTFVPTTKPKMSFDVVPLHGKSSYSE